MPELSIIVAFRDRDTQRVRRFLGSLSEQTYHDFELIFVDYGSNMEVAASVEMLCTEFDFCKYFYIDSRGQYWNKSRALNFAIHEASGNYILSTDIDIIFAATTLSDALGHLSEDTLIQSRAYMLQENWQESQLSTTWTHLALNPEDAVGMFILAPKQSIEAINGYDEYYMIWGFEDIDLSQRLRQSGLKLTWANHEKHPIFHQWHPRGSVHLSSYPIQWWNDMAIHHALKSQLIALSQLRHTERSILHGTPTSKIALGIALNPFDRSNALNKITGAITRKAGVIIEVEVDTTTVEGSSGSSRLNSLNEFASKLGLPVSLVNTNSTQRESTVQFLHYFILRSLVTSDLLQDYYIFESNGVVKFRLQGHSSSEQSNS